MNDFQTKTVDEVMEHRGISRKTFLIYLLQFPLFGGVAKYLYGFKPLQHYLLNKFSVAGFYYYKGPEIVDTMKLGEILDMKPDPDNIHDKYAVELHYKDTIIGYIPRSDNRHISRLLQQGLNMVCTIREVNPDEDTWHMCKVKVELVA
jgi:hypothetical protein